MAVQAGTGIRAAMEHPGLPWTVRERPPKGGDIMTLSPGARLGQYEVRELIGAGGMGEVYRAHDSKLDRDVAIKVLPEIFARDPERLARFKREARLLASLNHPNIATIHGLEEANGAHFLVMELVPGETLGDVIRDSRLGTHDSAANPSRAREQAGPGIGSAKESPLPHGRGSDSDGGVFIDEALEITTQICDALEHAHERGVIHRDLKPANVKLTSEGKVKVLDFGLAKAFAGDGASGVALTPVIDSNSPTVSRLPAQQPPDFSPTIPGTIMGTAAYMSPEQARGKAVDKRTDIWALGCVLYELLTGEGAFYQSPGRKRGANQSRDREGAGVRVAAGGAPPLANARGSEARGTEAQDDEPDTVQDILARVLHAEPDWSLLPAATPPGIRTLLRRCLQKDARQRIHCAADAQIQIAESQAAPGAIEPAGAMPSRNKVWRWALLSGLACALITGLAFWTLRPAATPQPVAHLAIPLPPNEALAGTASTSSLALSPDGTQLVYTASSGSAPPQLYLRSLDALEARPLAGTEGAASPFFSPDGQWIGFFADGKLKKVPSNGGAVLTLADALNNRGAAWGPKDTIVFVPPNTSVLYQVGAAGGQPQQLTKLARGESSHNWPQLLPDGKTLLYSILLGVNNSTDSWQIVAQRLDTGDRKILVRGGGVARYIPAKPSGPTGPDGSTGHLIYYHAGTIMAAPFDPKRLVVTGTPAPVLEGVQSTIVQTSGGMGQFSVSQSGSLVYVPGSFRGSLQSIPVWVDRKGAVQPLAAPPRAYNHPQLSPDGSQLAVTISAVDKDDIWVFDLARGSLTRLTFEGINHVSQWTPDGKRMVFRSIREGIDNLYWKSADGGGAEEQITHGEKSVSLSSISPDGKLAFYSENNPGTQNDLWMVPLEGERKPGPILQTPFAEDVPKISPDGRWMAYVSNESGRAEVYVRAFPGPGGKWQISTEGGGEPLWARNGRELFFWSGDKFMDVEITTQPSSQVFQAGAPRLLFAGKFLRHGGILEPAYDVSPDGQRFLMLKPIEQQEEALTRINVVLNWFEELKQKVPTK
jgi:eukaryotic-like serine/threonine-protein kinase